MTQKIIEKANQQERGEAPYLAEHLAGGAVRRHYVVLILRLAVY